MMNDLTNDFSSPIVNRVAESDIETYNLEALWDDKPVVAFDLEPYLLRGLMLREKDFRQAMKAYDWAQHADEHVAVFCSTPAIIPTWAYMLVGVKLNGIAASVAFGTTDALIRDHFIRALEAEDWSRYANRIVVVKGCNSPHVPTVAYMIATQKLQGVARKLMYGEPCSSVPLWRKPKPKRAAPTGAKRPAVAAKPAAIGLMPPPGAKPGARPKAPGSRPASKPVSLPPPLTLK
ncbi:MAG: DUF2480 family protein [Bacteroidota bacterium]